MVFHCAQTKLVDLFYVILLWFYYNFQHQWRERILNLRTRGLVMFLRVHFKSSKFYGTIDTNPRYFGNKIIGGKFKFQINLFLFSEYKYSINLYSFLVWRFLQKVLNWATKTVIKYPRSNNKTNICWDIFPFQTKKVICRNRVKITWDQVQF